MGGRGAVGLELGNQVDQVVEGLASVGAANGIEGVEQADDGLTEISAKVARDEFVPRRAFSVDELCADWLASLLGLRATTIAGYEYDLAPLRETHGALSVQRLTRRHIDDLVTDLSVGGTKTAKGHVRKPWRRDR